MPAGRPSTYKKQFAKQAEKLAVLGATDQEMADFFEVDVRTLYRWKHDHDEFCQSLKSGKDAADERVERSLYQRAVGYEQDEVKIFMPGGADAPVYAPFRAKIAPDTTAAIFWLKNRRSQNWRDKQQHEHSGPDGTAMSSTGSRKHKAVATTGHSLPCSMPIGPSTPSSSDPPR